MKLIIILGVALFIYSTYWTAFIHKKLQVSKKLIHAATPYSLSSNDLSKTLLVLGDSTAVGVGARSASDTVPAKVSHLFHSTYVENYAISGAVVADLTKQIANAKQKKYDVILVQIGANDMIRFRNADATTKELENILENLKEKSATIILLSAGNLGGAPLIPHPFRKIYTNLNLRYHANFEEMSKRLGIIYVNTYSDPSVDPFMLNPQKYFAGDSFHPSSDGYEIWFEKVKQKIQK